MPGGPWLVNGPDVALEDADALAGAHEALHADLHAFLLDYFAATRGIDLNAVIEEAAAAWPERWQAVWDRYADRLRSVPRRRFIAVSAHTTTGDVLAAFRLIKAGFPRATGGRDKRDRLACVQALIWAEEYGLSHRQIADRFGWPIKPKRGQKPWSERVRQHIADGREIVAQRNRAA